MARTSFEYRKATAALYGGSPRLNERWMAAIWALLSGLLACVSIYKSVNRDFWMPLLLLFQAASFSPNLPNTPPQDVPLKTLEDRADYQFGRSFDELSPAEQDRLLGEQQQSSTLFAPLSPGLKFPDLLPDLVYLAKLHRAQSSALLGSVGLFAAHLILLLQPRLPIVADCLNQARLWFWCIFELLLLPLLFLIWQGPRRLQAENHQVP